MFLKHLEKNIKFLMMSKLRLKIIQISKNKTQKY